MGNESHSEEGLRMHCVGSNKTLGITEVVCTSSTKGEVEILQFLWRVLRRCFYAATIKERNHHQFGVKKYINGEYSRC